MPNIHLQDLTAVINPTSRYNAGYDTVHVETLLVTDEPLQPDMCWYVPSGVTVPPEVLAVFKATGMAMYPVLEQNLLAGTQDILANAQQNNLNVVEQEAAKLMMRAVLKKTPLTPVPGTPNTYLVAYDYKIYPIEGTPNVFDFKIRLPFDGLGVSPQGGRVQVTVLTPIGAQIDDAATVGIADNGQPISKNVTALPNTGRIAVNFAYQRDPDFTVRYHY